LPDEKGLGVQTGITANDAWHEIKRTVNGKNIASNRRKLGRRNLLIGKKNTENCSHYVRKKRKSRPEGEGKGRSLTVAYFKGSWKTVHGSNSGETQLERRAQAPEPH